MCWLPRLLVVQLLTVFAKASSRASGLACLSNLKRLQMCWQNWVKGHTGFVPTNGSLFTNGVRRSTPVSWTGVSSAPQDAANRAFDQGLLFRSSCQVAPTRRPARPSHLACHSAPRHLRGGAARVRGSMQRASSSRELLNENAS